MFSKLIVVLATIAYVAAQEAARYPAGVDPSKCPNFPICDNAALHNTAPVNHYAPQPYSAPSYHQPAYYQEPAHQPWNHGHFAPAPVHYQAPQAYAAPVHNHIAPAPAGGDKYPAGVNPHSCPNYPYCDVNAGHNGVVRTAPLPGFTERLYPAGVSPQECPNYPEC